MNRFSFTVDTSVVVKWLNQEQEAYTQEALLLLRLAKNGSCLLFSSDLLPVEVINVLTKSKKLHGEKLKQAVHGLFSFPIRLVTTDEKIGQAAAKIAEQYDLTSYDSVYLAVAYQKKAPLITANPKDQGKFKKIPVLDIANWPVPKQAIEIYTDERLEDFLKNDKKY